MRPTDRPSVRTSVPCALATNQRIPGKNLEIRGFGTYKIVRRKARTGRNPKNSEMVQIPEKNAVKWKMSKIFFNKLNKNFTDNKISDTY